MSDIALNTGFILIGYALGCLTTGYYLVRHQLGLDVRSSGSGVVGATNVGRLLKKEGFVLTLAGDFGKGVMALSLAKWNHCHDPWLAFVLLAVVAGHIWPVQLGLKGGKGVATTFGGLMVYDPMLTLALTGVFVVIFLISGNRETGGLCSFLCLPVLALLAGKTPLVTAVCLALAMIVLWAHRANLMVIYRRHVTGQR